MKVYFNKHVFEHKWETVTQALWLKYPNPFSTHVLASDIIERSIDTQGQLHTTRLLLKTSSVPAWGRNLIHVPEAYIIEESTVDRENSTMLVKTRNVSYTGLVVIEESQTFGRHPENRKWTLVKTEAKFQSNLPWGLRNALESFGYSKFKETLVRSRQAIQYILESLREKKEKFRKS